MVRVQTEKKSLVAPVVIVNARFLDLEPLVVQISLYLTGAD